MPISLSLHPLDLGTEFLLGFILLQHQAGPPDARAGLPPTEAAEGAQALEGDEVQLQMKPSTNNTQHPTQPDERVVKRRRCLMPFSPPFSVLIPEDFAFTDRLQAQGGSLGAPSRE